jgi:hypothetical protein
MDPGAKLFGDAGRKRGALDEISNVRQIATPVSRNYPGDGLQFDVARHPQQGEALTAQGDDRGIRKGCAKACD